MVSVPFISRGLLALGLVEEKVQAYTRGHHEFQKELQERVDETPVQACDNTKGYSGTYLAMGFANVRAGTLLY